MRKIVFTLLTGCLFGTSSLPAQVFEVGVSAGPQRISGKDLGTSGVNATGRYSLDDGWHLAFRMAINNWAYFGQESGYIYNRTKLLFADGGQTGSLGGMAIHQGFYNLVAYATPEGKRVRPFVSGGGHFANFVPPGSSVTSGGGSNKFGLNYGGGIKVRVRPNWLVRLDVRQNWHGKPFDLPNQTGSMKLLQVSVGLAFAM